jgi:hypothetical protein
LPNLRTLPHELRRRWDALVKSHSLVAATVSFLVAVRPVWWVLRGITAYAIIATLLGVNGATWWPLALAFVVLSVQVGRGWMSGRAWVRWAVRVGSAIAVVAMPFLLGWALSTWNNGIYQSYYQEPTTYPQGLTSDGQQIDNIYAYDAQGRPIDRVQLFDQNGQPLNLTPETTAQWWDAQDGSMVVPSTDVPGRAGWNVYPLRHVNDWSDYEDDGRIDDSEISPAQFPFSTAKPLAGALAEQPMTDGTIAAPAATPSPAP